MKPKNGDQARSIRGGSWYDFAIGACCAYRDSSGPGTADFSDGFRPARSLVP